jgi:hypothetical protein
MGPVDHRLALSHPALVSARSKKSFSNVISPIFAWSVFTSTGGSTPLGEDRDGAAQQLFAPLADLVWMHIEALGQLGERGLAFHGRQGDLRVERWRVVPTGTTGHREGS